MMKKIGLKEAVSIGIGGMVGGGIFAVLGLAVSLAHGATPVSFLVAGIIALLTCNSYSHLSVIYPDRGGTVYFINQGFGEGIFSGAANNLLWLSYVIMLALYSSAFGSYAPNLLLISGSRNIDYHIYASAIIILATFINYYNVKVVGTIETYAVFIKLIILVAFIFIGAYGLFAYSNNVHQLYVTNWVSPIQLITGGMVIFVAYEGFELIANAAPDIENPKKNIPKAYFYSVVFVIFLYLAIAIITVGSLPFSRIAKAQDYVLAEAAKPMLGNIGFIIITIAALISTFSAINASLFGGSRVNYQIAVDKELPKEFKDFFWNRPIGLLITSALTLLLVNTVNLQNISIAGSINFLIIFTLVNYVWFKLAKKNNGKKTMPFLGFFFCGVALITLIIQQYSSHKTGVFVSALIIITCIIYETGFRRYDSYKKIKSE
ncbi:MAG: APC family permease [Bacteroidota bacterium]|nr:APC family permease [Bacteroidota bacterium]